MTTDQELKNLCQKQSLSFKVIAQHRQRIKDSLSQGDVNTLKIIDTCRLDNDGIFPLVETETELGGYVAFTPAAGASSRYLATLASVKSSLAQGQSVPQLSSDADNISSWNLPTPLAALLIDKDHSSNTREQALSAMNLPKALLPCVKEGLTFLEMKLKEHAVYDCFDGQVFIVRPEHVEMFTQKLASLDPKLPAGLLKQGLELCTARFDESGDPIIVSDGQLSLVPAGHGMLTHVFPDVRKQFPQAHSIFIRNIDNVSGLHPDAKETTRRFLKLHHFILQNLNDLRQSIRQKDYDQTAKSAGLLLDLWPRDSDVQASFISSQEETLRPAWRVMCQIFGYDPSILAGSTDNSSELLSALLDRPLNLLGQVENSDRNVGGAPVITEHKGRRVKICLEAPHASADDKQAFLQNPEKATHFNPVYVATELPSSADAYETSDSPFWMLAKKPFEGTTAYYHETVLYELLGNSLFANTVFIEVPRYVFNPHKTIQGSSGRQLSDWT